MPHKRKISEDKEKVKKIPNVSYFTLYRFASKYDKLMIAISIITSVISGAIVPYSITLMAEVFQNMIEYAKNNKTDASIIDTVRMFSIKNSINATLILITSYIGTALINLSAIRQVYKIRKEYLKAALNQDFTFYDLHHTGDFATRMSDDIIKVEDGIGDKVSALIHGLALASSCYIMAFLRGWKLALFCLIPIPITFILVGVAGKIADCLYKKESKALSKASAIAEEVLSSIRTVYAFSGQQKEVDRYTEPLVEAARISIKKEFFNGLAMGFLFFCIFGAYALSFYFGIYFIINDPKNYTADIMFSVFFGIMTGSATIGALGTFVESFGVARGAGSHIFYIIDTIPTINPLLDRGLKPATLEGNIELKNVKFSYPSRPEVPVLKGVNISIKRGESVALVGQSGSGKSTIVQLISRYYDVDDGNVLVDGRDVRDVSVRWLRAQVGLVGQEPVLFNATVRDNIRYGREDATDEDIETAAKQANAHNFIIKLPKGYDTVVGERGASISGGQKQRIAIARALVRDPKILLLDEATSALDTASEAKVQAALDKAAEGRTTLIVAHRLSTVRNVNMIYVFNKGVVAESGTYADLMTRKGTFYEMVMLQAPTELNDDVNEGEAFHDISNITVRDEEEVVLQEEESEEALRKRTKISIWRVMALNKPEWRSITIGSFFSVVNGFGMPLFAVVFGHLFGTMASNDTNALLKKANESVVSFLCIGFFVGVANFIQGYMFGRSGAFLTKRLRVLMFANILRQEVGYFDEKNNSSGALCARLSNEVANISGATGHRIGTILQAIGAFGIALSLAIYYEWRMGCVYLLAVPFVLGVMYYEGKMSSDESYNSSKAVENSTKIAIEAVSNIRTVASLGREAKIVKEFAAQLDPSLPSANRLAHCKGIVTGFSRCMFNYINAGSLFFAAYLIAYKGVHYGNIIIVTQSLQVALNQSSSAFLFAPDVHRGISAAGRVVHVIKRKSRISDPETPEIRGFVASGDASLNKVQFRYPTRPGVQVLRDFDLQIDKGKTYALVGGSGCGKSTVIQLLERYYDADRGYVALDNIPITNLLLSEARQGLGLVSQEPVLFDRTIKENIAYGDNSREATETEIIEAAKQANIHNFIIMLPLGYETNIGAKGTLLSGGQKQRIAIARALLRKPHILLLDEATSALDTESEKVVQEALDQAKAGRTCVTIAHRLSTIRDADVICVVHAGRVAERGTHSQLMEAKGLYYALHRSSI